jgi:carbon storage regulator
MPQQEVVVTILEMRGDRVRIGIEAPAHIRVHRHEVWLRIQDGSPEKPLASVASA